MSPNSQLKAHVFIDEMYRGDAIPSDVLIDDWHPP